MNVKALLTDDDAVSPVIGVILMVAITVILAAVIGTFVLGLQNRVDQAAPTASFSWEFNDQGTGWGDTNDFVNITHDGGDKLDVETISVLVDGTGASPVNDSTWDPDVTAGSTLTLTDDAGYGGSAATVSAIDEGDDIRIVWSSAEGSSTQTIGQNEVN